MRGKVRKLSRVGAILAFLAIGAGLIVFAARRSGGQATPRSALPKVVLVGDSIRWGYAPRVARRLEGKAVVVSAEPNGLASDNVLAHLDEWVIREDPDVVHFNCGLHDLQRSRATGRHPFELATYVENLGRIVDRIKGRTKARILFASTTPILDQRQAKLHVPFDMKEADVREYNDAAFALMSEHGVPVDDLHAVIESAGTEALLTSDGTHATPEGYERLAEAVADCVLRQITLMHPLILKTPASGPEAARRYLAEAEARDRQVPEAYRKIEVPEFPVPRDAADWAKRRPEVRASVLQSLGDLPPRPSPPRARTISRELHKDYVLEKVRIESDVPGGTVPALYLLPARRVGKVPAILWLHSSTPDSTQILTPNSNGGSEPLGEVLVREGYAVLAPDAHWHGERSGTGPSGTAETGRAEQESLFKLDLWQGRTLWGMFVRDDQLALDYLCGRAEIDPARIGATGMSMGSTRAWWLAAVDDRVAAVAAVACLTRYQNLIRHGELRQHGVYYFVNGLLNRFDSEGVLALIAPRPFLALTGELDAGSPADGVLRTRSDRRQNLRGPRGRKSVAQRALSRDRARLHARDAGRGSRLVRPLAETETVNRDGVRLCSSNLSGRGLFSDPGRQSRGVSGRGCGVATSGPLHVR